LFAKMTAFRDETRLVALIIIGGASYLALIWGLLGRKWLRGLIRSAEPAGTL
jgi:hypothetical protein